MSQPDKKKHFTKSITISYYSKQVFKSFQMAGFQFLEQLGAESRISIRARQLAQPRLGRDENNWKHIKTIENN